MPNRIIKESIRTSDSVNELSWFEECLFYRLIVSCDDYGRFDGRPAIIKGTCFPLKDVTAKNIESGLSRLVAVGLVRHYEVEGKPYLQLSTWEQHQTIRAKKSKYPSPDDGQMIEHENNCMQMHADAPVIQSNRNPIRESKSYSRSACAQNADVEPIPLNDGTEWTCPTDDYEEYVRLYPAVDVHQAFRDMRAWCNSNKERRKTRRGIKRFVNGWLSREQDKAKEYAARHRSAKTRFNNFEERQYSEEMYRRLIEGGESNDINS